MEILKNAVNGQGFSFVIPLINSTSRPDYKASPTLAAGDVKVARYDSSAWVVASINTLPVAVTGMLTHLEVTLSVTEMTADDDTRPIIITFVDAAGDEWDDQTVIIRLGDIRSNTTKVTNTDVTNINDFKADVSGLSSFDPATDEVDIGKVKGVAVTNVGDFQADLTGVAAEATSLAIAALIGTPAGVSVSADIAAVKVDSAAIVNKLPVTGNMSNYNPETSTVDGMAYSYINELIAALMNGRYSLDTPDTGKITFYKRNNTTVLTVVDVTTAGRSRVS